MRREDQSLFREYVESALIAIVIALLVRTFILTAYKIPTGSMIPTLRIGDCIFAWKLPYGVRVPLTSWLLVKPVMPERGDVVVFKSPDDPKVSVVKRVVAVGGDRVEIRKRDLYVNGEKAEYTATPMSDQEDKAIRDFYEYYTEKISGREYRVMFRHGQQDDKYGPEVVPDGKIFVLGDNRDSSEDSRTWGAISMENLEGRAFMIWLSLDWSKRNEQTGFPTLRKLRTFTAIH